MRSFLSSGFGRDERGGDEGRGESAAGMISFPANAPVADGLSEALLEKA